MNINIKSQYTEEERGKEMESKERKVNFKNKTRTKTKG